jgi:hypothetical protein
VSDILPTPEDFGAPLASEAHTSLSGQLAAEWANTLDPKNSLAGGYLFRRAREATAGGLPAPWNLSPDDPDLNEQIIRESRAAIPDTSIDDARARVKQEGLDGHLHLPDQPSIKSPVLDLMIQEAHDRRDREAAIARGPDSFFPNALGFVTSMGVGMIDPVNVAAFSIPVLGEARVAGLIARAGESLIARAGVKAGIGGTQGAGGTAILQPADWWLHTRDGQDYTFAEALRSVVMGAGIGSLAHSGFGAIGDVRARLRGRPLAGSPEDLLLRGLTAGADVRIEPPEEAAPIGEVPGVAAPTAPEPARARAPHVAEVVADLPPQAREDMVHAAMADAIEGNEPRAAQMLNIAADHDPRIAGSLEPERIASAAIEHRGSIYTGVTHGDAQLNAAGTLGRPVDDLAAEVGGSGFMTNRGRYVLRDEAEAIAANAAQLSPHAPPSDRLKAEDLNFQYQAEARTAIEAGPRIPDLVTAPKPRGRAAAHPDTLSLGEHLASKGGLKPDPELRAIYGGDRGPFVPGFGPLIRKGGMSLDEALSSASQHGYFADPHDMANGTAGSRGREGLGLIQRDLLDALDRESRGQKHYKLGHLEATKYDPEQEKHVIFRALETELEKSGADVSAIDPKLLDRTVEIVHREGVSDVLAAYERAIMEDQERYEALADARRSEHSDIPGWDVPADAGTASGDGRDHPADGRQAGRPEQGAGQGDGAQSSRAGGRDLAAAAADPRWRELADVKPDYDQPDALEESRAADRVEEPASAGAPERALTALEAEAKRAEEIWKQIEPTLTEKERALVNDVLGQLKLDKDARDKIISDGVACLVGAVG